MKVHTLAAAAAVLTAVLCAPHQTHAAPPAAQDPCNAPLPVQLAFTSGPAAARTTLRGGGATMTLTQFSPSLNGMARRIHQLNGGPALVPNDRIAEFTFFTPGRTHIYAGPVHVFHHGAYLHVCRAGTVMVDASGNTTEQANPYRLSFRFDGWIHGTQASGNAWAAGVHFRLAGATHALTNG